MTSSLSHFSSHRDHTEDLLQIEKLMRDSDSIKKEEALQKFRTYLDENIVPKVKNTMDYIERLISRLPDGIDRNLQDRYLFDKSNEERKKMIRLHLVYLKILRDTIAEPLHVKKILSLLDTWIEKMERRFSDEPIVELHLSGDLSSLFPNNSDTIALDLSEELWKLRWFVEDFEAILKIQDIKRDFEKILHP